MKIKVAVIILFFMLVYAGVYSLMSIFTPEIVMESSFQAVTGESIQNIGDEKYLEAFLSSGRSGGLFALTTVIAGFFILFAAFRKTEKWSWWAFLVVAFFAWAWGTVNGALVNARVYFLMNLGGMVIFLAGVLLPVRAFFSKKS